ncbi:carbohydrate ABC transporter permease [Xylanivirga thermophila]|uniref:carbohydrate ABC transporter permease n=1 Tax=Xylanivirga thermophila TaxID=2496273 RepID=UPI00101DF041|nr:carbohydrate ABC transporter permease [Xylanivirga thermophila]
MKKGVTNNKIQQRTPLEKFFHVLNVIILLGISLTIILPFLNIIALSFNGGRDAASGGVYFWPRAFTWNNYKEVFTDNRILNGYKITISRTIIGVILGVLCNSMAAFALKKKDLPGRTAFTFIIFFTMLFGGGVVPYYMLLKALNLRNSYWVYIIPNLYSAWNIIMIRTFFESISISLEESAKLDGCSDFRVFFQIIMPLSKPVIAVIALFTGVAHWNDWFTGAFYVNNKDLYPVQTILQEMLTNQQKLKNIISNSHYSANLAKNLVTGDSLKMATVMVSTVPIMCVYPFIQKYFTKGVMIGAVKG